MADVNHQEKGTLSTGQDQIHAPVINNSEGLIASHEKRPKGAYWMRWWVEVASLLVSVTLFIAIVVILKKYNGKLQPKWQYDFNLNALIAILSTFLRITMMDVVTKLMGQLKWNWFSKPRKLSQLEAINDGSRAPWASFVLFLKLRRPHPLLLGGAITVLSLALGSFIQQAVTSVPCVVPVTNATASVLIRRSIPPVEVSRLGAGQFEIDWAVKSALQAAFAGSIPAVAVNCPTGNCTFPTSGGIAYSSMGLCTKCIDTSSKITQLGTVRNGVHANFTLPNNASIWTTAGSQDAYIDVKFSAQTKAPSWMVELEPTLSSFDNSSIGFVNVLSFTAAGCEIKRFENATSRVACVSNRPDLPGIGGTPNIVGTGCVLYGCVKNYEARVTNGELIEKIVSTIPAPGKSEVTSVGVTLPCYVEGIAYDLSNMSSLDASIAKYINNKNTIANNTIPLDCVYELDWQYISGTVKYLKTLFEGTGTYTTAQGTINGMPIPSFSDNWWLASLYKRGLADIDSITSVFENITEAFTNYQRLPHPEFADKYNFRGKGKYWEPSAVYGVVHETTICTQFNWLWLLFPAILLIATGILFLSTAIIQLMDKRRLPVWKSSILPLLFYGLGDRRLGSGTEYRGSDSDPDDQTSHLLSAADMAKIASQTTVRFRATAHGGGFEEVDRRDVH